MAEQDNTSWLNNITPGLGTVLNGSQKVYTRPDIGFADGYSSQYNATNVDKRDHPNVSKEEHVKSASSNLLLDNQSGHFRRIPGYSLNRTITSDEYEDPTFLIFDLSIIKYESSLFRNDVIGAFFNEYSDGTVPELAPRFELWTRFTDLVLKIFPSDSVAESSGSKQHYIESVSGLDVLLNPIINYPEDKITFTVTEDVAMTMMYLTELYNNMTYSYDTHRYMIPDNLLRFNMKITIRDVRNMRKPIWNTSPTGSNFNENISSFTYVLHDCQFDFMKTRNFSGEIKRAGFGAASPGISAGGNIDMNFKSYSKIMAPLLIDNSIVLDLREKESQYGDKNLYKVYTRSDYKSPSEAQSVELNDFQNKNNKTRSASDIISTSNQNKKPGELHFPEINTDVRGFVKNVIGQELKDVRQVIINQVMEEANQLITQGEKAINKKLGFTIGRVNVYYNSLDQKISRISYMFEQFLESEADKLLGRGPTQVTHEKSGNVYSLTNTDVESHYNEKIPKGTVEPKGQHNDKYPKGRVEPKGKLNDKYPKGDLNPDGKYNQKYPKGSVEPKGQPNDKYPEGIVEPKGTYNQKLPEGVVEPKGGYNQKYPKGTVEPLGQYNEKYPDGSVEPLGQYNEKYPNGSVEPLGTYNEKYPEGVVEPLGKPNDKHPKGSVEPKGNYNEKYPEGSIEPKGGLNEKYPEGSVEPQGKPNDKYPEGNVEPKGTYNEKYPTGLVEPLGKPNDKYPSGKVEPKGQPNDKYPEGDVEPKGTYNQKLPEGRVEENGKYHDKTPSGNIYNIKNKTLPPDKKKLGNVNRQK